MSSIYKTYNQDQVEELLSNYLIDSWSYSRVSTFVRNEKEFEMRYLYNERSKSSATTIAGQAYHKALELYFTNLMEGIGTDIADMQQAAFDHISDQSADIWKISKTRPTIQDCINDAVAIANKGISNFLSEVKVYLSQIKRVLAVELRLKAWITVNGVDIPLPCYLAIDVVVETIEDKRAIVDHKLRTAFTDEKEVKFTIGKQAITYVKGYESEFEEKIDEVWFVENKTSKNKDGSPQLILNKVVMDDSTRRLYEAILYEPLRRMILAVNDADYVYLINDNDNFTDKAEIYEFWAKTMLAEIEEFNITENKKPLIEKRLKKIRDASLATATPRVIRNFKKYAQEFIPYDLTNKDMTNQEKIEHVLRSFGIIAKVQHTFDGYSSSSYLLEMNAGTSISNVNKYRLDIANALNVPNVRIQKDLVVYEGKSYLTIESGKKGTGILLWDKSKLKDHKIPLGVDNFQQTVYWDLDNHSTPHMLICGATGSGKSVSIKSTVEYALKAGIHEIYMFDPKYEFTSYNSNPRISVFNEIENIEEEMEKLVAEMEKRVKEGISTKTLVIFDEFADAVANSKKGKELDIIEEVQVGFYAPKKIQGMFGEEISDPIPKMGMKVTGRKNSLEENLRILLQKGRSSGFRIIAATQRASTKVITGDAKVNFPVQVCFRVPKDIDSIVVIDEPGAESLNGRGDGLIKSPEYLGVVRFQAFYKD
ncbi:DNA translocase FtsK [Dysgonomonas sp. 511]|uniref:DNA translocase FtsK n=1 Tax=Dysgonomonas sp. 511 TaxID=2302930 RepID=UPI0013D3773D|nr:DNA translocase FtsK [Dysgonomonas sp. 511]NDV77869.1 DUF87 domain-containing protein [Dysgonomonas sp. 511]